MEPIVEWSMERGGKSRERRGGREKKGRRFIVNRQADRSRHDNKEHRARGEREKYTRETEDRDHICQEVLESVVRYYGRGGPGINRSWAIVVALKWEASWWYQSSVTLRGRPVHFFLVAVLDSAAGST